MSRIATVNYHVHRSQRQAYQIDPAGTVGTLISPEHAVTQVQVHDERRGEAQVTFASDSVEFLHAPSAIEAFTLDQSWRQRYDDELRAILTRTLGAVEVMVFDHTVRAATRKPARNVHSDYSPAGAEKRLVDLLGDDTARRWQAGHYAFINIWRPLAPINSAPLGFVRPDSAPADDWLVLDLIYPDRLGQIMGLVANPAHEWIYRSRMTPDEIAIFNIYDNRGRPSIGHSALDLVEDPADRSARQSIESRTLVRFATAEECHV